MTFLSEPSRAIKLALQPTRCRRLGRVRLEVALADDDLMQETWLGNGRSVTLIGKDFECDEMPSLITHKRESLSPGITKPGGAIPTVHLPAHTLATKMYESA
jgi:hypothetical protein